MPSSAGDIIMYCRESGISSVELMGSVVEQFAGIPGMPPKPDRNLELTEDEAAEYRKAVEEAREKQKEWRAAYDVSGYKELKKLFEEAGVGIHIVKFSPAKWSDEEIDYAFKAAKVLGASGVSNEIGHEACERLGKFAEKHGMYAVFHNHLQPGKPGFSFQDFLDYSPANMLNLDVGHYFGATGAHPNEIIKQYHNRIFSLHLKDKTGKYGDPPNTNMVWGEGDTPLADILTLIRDKDWPIYCDIELEYRVPEGSDALAEVTRCVDFCREILLN
jgi:sugar phosphate isomerase/epimerase